jgi:hypothetical protein
MDKKCNIAYGLGVNALMKGQKCVPAKDKLFIELIAGCKIGESIPYSKAWLKGWTAANLTEGIEKYIIVEGRN